MTPTPVDTSLSPDNFPNPITKPTIDTNSYSTMADRTAMHNAFRTIPSSASALTFQIFEHELTEHTGDSDDEEWRNMRVAVIIRAVRV